MCGIVGIFNFGSTPQDEREALVRMRDAMVHRGPDDAGVEGLAGGRVWLGHRRLSIVDLSPAGHQPMSNEDGSVWLTFNGEIYNHENYRAELLAKGHTLRSRSDTEAIVHLYEDDGDACLDKLDGMFAIGIWDQRRERLLLARDRLGKKPLYYAVVNGRLLFASEIKALLAYPGIARELDLEALNLYLTFGNVPPPFTLFGGIRKLPAAHRLVCDRMGRVTIERYWSPVPETPFPTFVDRREAVENVRVLLRAAVKKRMMADVPIGCFLSGGVDSSSNVALMSELVSQPLRTYCIGFEGFGPEQRFADQGYAKLVAERFGCIHREVVLTAEQCQASLPELVYEQDEPIADPACLPMRFLCKEAREDGIIVVLVGEGSDEVFGGYDDMARILGTASQRFNRVRGLPHFLQEGLVQASRFMHAPGGRVDVLRRARDGEPLYWGLDVVFWDEEKRSLLSRSFQQELKRIQAQEAVTFVRGVYDSLLRKQPNADLLQQMSVMELGNRLTELLLMRVDKFSMAQSVEARAPFLDPALVSYGLSLPASLKIHGGRTKSVLKDAVAPYLPDEVISRPKQGFRVPLPAWLRGPLANWAKHHVLEGALARRGLLESSYLQGLWEKHVAGTADHSFDLWTIVNLSAWYEHWIERKAAA